MTKFHFGSLPIVAKVGVGAGMLFIWILLERVIIEPLGIYHYMPFYRVEGVCAWDVLVTIAISAWIIRFSK
jgi:hypothetical protein